jgi:predicted Zn-dependent protease
MRIFSIQGKRLFNRAAFGLLILAACFAIYGCYVNPATGKEQFSLYSESQEISMGKEANDQVIASIGLYPDSSWQNYIQTLGMSLASKTTRPDLPWSFHIVDDPTVNAFALPGGFIYVTRGILAYINNEAELASVVGHEIGHVTARHSVTQMTKQQIVQIGVAAGTIMEPKLEKYGQLINTGLGLMFLKFSRDDEKQADDLGLRYMYNDGYDPNQMVHVFEVLDRISGGSGSGRIPEWLSTHPDPGNRAQRIRAEIDTIKGVTSGRKVARDGYLSHLKGLVFGDDPREGYFVGTTFYHPQLRFQFTFPEGWTTQNQKQGVLAASPKQDAVIQITISPSTALETAAEKFFNKEGVKSGPRQITTVNGQPATGAEFSVVSQDGPIAGNATFVAYGGKIYEILALSGADSWGTYRGTASTSIKTFAPLTDKRRISVEPKRLDIVVIPKAMTLEEFSKEYPSTVSLDQLALINQAEPSTMLSKGEMVKRVIGGVGIH